MTYITVSADFEYLIKKKLHFKKMYIICTDRWLTSVLAVYYLLVITYYLLPIYIKNGY